MALVSLKIGKDDEVIVPSLTFIAPVNAVSYVSATPVFVDIEDTYLGMNIEEIKNKVTDKTKAIIYVHLFGITKNLNDLKNFCKIKGIYLIEDVAESIGGSIDGKHAGDFGDLAIYSFYGNKIISSGEGGAISTNNLDLAQSIRILRNHGMSPKNKYYFEHIGYNYRMTNVSAAILLAQIYRFYAMFARRKDLFARYDKVIDKFTKVRSIEKNKLLNVSPWLYPLICESNEMRNNLMTELKIEGIETRPFFIPIHTLPMYKNHSNDGLSKSIDVANRGLCLPTSSAFSSREINYVIKKLKKVLKKYDS